MAIISILRDTPNNVSFVRVITTNTLSQVATANYIANQMDNIRALNSGFWQWYTSDILAVSASDGNALFTFTDATFASLNEYSGGSSGNILPGLMNNFAYYASAGTTLSPITIANARILLGITGIMDWVDVTGTTQVMATNTGYVVDNTSLITFTLPAISAFGDELKVIGFNSGGWKINVGLGQTIHVGNESVTPSTGNIASTNLYDNVTLRCVVPDAEWVVEASQGNITFA